MLVFCYFWGIYNHSSFTKFLDHPQRRTTVSRTPLDERSARRRELYLTTHNAKNKQTTMPPTVAFEPATPASERLQTHAHGFWDWHILKVLVRNLWEYKPVLRQNFYLI